MKFLFLISLFSVHSMAALPYIWPAPKKATTGTATVSVKASREFFAFRSPGQAPETLRAAFERYFDTTFPHVATTTHADLSFLDVTVDDLDESHPQLETDETYTLAIDKNGAQLHAKTIYGAMHGLETFSQLVFFDFESQSYQIKGCPWAIDDAPRFAHRGLMIDSARHFETLASIKAIIRSLPYAKINVLHWHMVDTQSFPFESKQYPKLWNGAYSEYEKYTQADIATVVEYARMFGVRVIVEFDMPGHGASWCTGYPEICPSASCQQPLNVANNFTFELIDGLLSDCTGRQLSTKDHPSGLFPDNYIHLGGDEVDTSCWTKDPTISKWLAAHNMTGDDGYAYFVKKVSDIAISQGRNPIQWSEVYDHFKNTLDKRTIVHVWKSVTNVTEVVAAGYKVLRNVGYYNLSWYLDNLNVKWDAVYQNEPCQDVPDDLCPMILGGHGEMWGETVDMSDLEQTVWPRLAAIAERLWSQRDVVGNVAEATPRIEYFRCLLNRRGVHAAPVGNALARSAPPGPGGCLTQ